jgi:PAS domain S-box-containing protein
MSGASLFDALRQHAGSQLTTVPLARETLVHLTQTLEQLVLDRKLASLVCAGLGYAEAWGAAALQLRALAGPAAYVLVFGRENATLDRLPGVIPVRLEADDPLVHERFFLVVSHTFSALLCARARPIEIREPGLPSYDAVWSFDPQVVEVGLDWLTDYLARQAHAQALETVYAVRQVLAPRSIDLLALSQFATEMIRFEEQLHQELARVERERMRVYEREALLSTIARAFIDLPSDQIDVAVDAALMAIGQFCGADYCLLFERHLARDAFAITYQWQAGDLPPLSADEPGTQSGFLAYDSSLFEPVLIEDLQAYAGDEALAERLRVQGVCSIAAIPMVYREVLRGFVALASTRSRRWGDEERYLLETLMEIVVAALEHRRVERALGETESLLQRVIYSTNHLVYVFAIMKDRSIAPMFSSPNIEHMLGYPAALKLADWNFWLTLIHPVDLPEAEAQLGRLMRGEDSETEYRIRHADGRMLWMHDSARCEPGTGDVEWICYGLISDVTERKAVEQALRDRERLQMALESERKVGEMRNRFMLVVSHEFRTPLSIILTSSEMLDRYHDRLGPDRRHERLTIIRSQVQHLRAMLDEISIVIRAELGRLEYRPAAAEVMDFTRQVAEEMALTAGLLHRITVTAQPNALYALVDTTLLRHALTNLLSNAIKFSEPQAAIAVRVRLDAQSTPPGIIFEVEDSGIGIDQADLEHLFEPFFRGRNVGAISGTGLGLKVVRDCLTLHGGTVEAASTPGRGSLFTVRIPWHSTAPAEMEMNATLTAVSRPSSATTAE